jgi:hypothetical protein
MSFKLKSGNKPAFKMMGSTPFKAPGIFVGEGDDRRRIGKDEAADLESQGVEVTYTAADNPDKEEGAQQIKNLGEDFAGFDANLQNRANRGIYNPNFMLAMGADEPLTAEKAEVTIQKHENLEGGNANTIPGSQYFIHPHTGEKILLSEWDGPVDKNGNPMIVSKTTTTTQTTPTETTTTTTPTESEQKSTTTKTQSVYINGKKVEGKGPKPEPPKIKGDPNSKENQALLKEYYRALQKWSKS